MHNAFKIYDGQTNTVLVNSGVLLDGTGPEGYVDVGDAQWGVAAAIRNFEMWPNGLAVNVQISSACSFFQTGAPSGTPNSSARRELLAR